MEKQISITLPGKSATTVDQLDASLVTVSAKSITVAGVGTFAFSDTVNAASGLTLANVTVKFTADTALTGELDITGTVVANSGLTDVTGNDTGLKINATGALTLTGGNGNDALTLTTTATGTKTVDGGAGNDTLSAAVDGAILTGGTGADTFVANVSTGTATVHVDDYSYTQGDVVKASAKGEVSATGYAVATDGTVTVTNDKIAFDSALKKDTDGVYKLKVTDGATTTPATTVEYWTAAADKAATIDASAVTTAVVATGNNKTTDITTGAGNDTIKGADNGGVISAGAGTNTITVASVGNVDTIVVGKSQGANDVITGFKAGFDTASADVINLYDASITDITLKKSGKNIVVGNSTIAGASFDVSSGPIDVLVKDSANTVQKVSLASQDNATFTVSDAGNEAVLFYNANNNGIVDYTSYEKTGLKVDLSNTTKYKGITKIVASTDADVVATYVGGAAATTIDASLAGNAVSVWGGSSASDVMKLNATGDAVTDTVFFGSADGTDKVLGFANGFKSTDDVIRLWGGADFASPTLGGYAQIAADADNGGAATDYAVVRVGSAQLLVEQASTAKNAVSVKVQNEAGITKNISYTVDAESSSQLVGSEADASTGKFVSADFVIGKVGTDATKTDTVVYANGNRKVDLGDSSVYYSVENISMAGTNADLGNATLVGATNADSKINAGGVKGQTNDVFGGFGVNNDTLVLDNSAAADTVWYGVGQGNDTVTGFTDHAAVGASSEDAVRFWDLKLADVAKTYVAENKTNKVLKFKAAGNTLEVDYTTAALVGQVKVVTSDASTNAIIGAAVNYDKDAKLYFGTNDTGSTLTLTADVNTATKIDLAGGEGYYYSNINAVTATNATGYTTLTGAANVSETFTAGNGGSVMWGGGLASDTMNGASGVDEFWFGKGDGIDTATSVGAEDKVVLWNASSINDVTATVNGNDLVVSVNGASDALTIKSFADAATITFQAGTGSSATTYTYDTVKKAFK